MIKPKDINFGITETYPNKLYYGEGFLLTPISTSSKKVDFKRVDIESAIREEILRRFKKPSFKVVYILPYFNQKEFATQFIFVSGFSGTIMRSYPVSSVDEIEKFLQDPTLTKKYENWVEIYTTKDPVSVKEEQYKGMPLMDIVKSIVGYTDTDERRYLNKIITDFRERIWALKGTGII